ncbi:DUF302 domain-containing protein [Pseudonocardia asaccharolytica]|uniref:DUF302 domain-containing protein n=1 Tax=Pseudonocardia asaccharolytica TaxID=54010 RepID=UPI0004170CF4|nr:DUF302 domain-containing protein [Pseudonocardia asaccharolytica]
MSRTREVLVEQGFGVLTEIDVQATLREKRGLQMEPYDILGACNPDLAHQALDIDRSIGVLLPCNVVVSARDDGRRGRARDPRQAPRPGRASASSRRRAPASRPRRRRARRAGSVAVVRPAGSGHRSRLPRRSRRA